MGPDLLSLIPAIAPGTLVAITAFVLAGIFMQRARTAAMLVMIAGLLTLLQNGWIIFNQLVLLEWMFDDVISSDTYSIIATAAYNLFYLAISGLLLFAAFAGRKAGNTPASAAAQVEPRAEGNLPAHRGGLVLTFGLLGILLFAPLGIVAWILGSKDLNAMGSGNMDSSGEGMTTAGKVLGIIATVLMVIGLLVATAVLAVIAANFRAF
ncbi:MAG: hypothetical protein P1U59_11510 [Alcanivorax sp.]|jgi:hypothetical protein|uniref:hypothetical protein n=1 Tax=Alcanivorax sp. TaxID=1872427 RepID=UPI00199AF86F|nr:hypothetical protein [Alcanivorax sp.]MBD3643050.1 hypothetical protein [Alcanivorax sp.]MDF1725141.1 hypothetical protein [Alcanivorax sp.]